MKRIFSVLLVLAAASATASSFGPVHKKYIAHGWDLLGMTPREVLANADAWDRTGVDGVTLMINEKLAGGRQISHTRIMNDPPWPREQLKAQIAVFREIVKHPSLRESFISSWWAPQRRLAWNDDAAWANFAANMATVAWLAREGGLRGILVDAEDYPSSGQYTLQTGDAPYDETAKLARRRGAQVFKAIFDEYPDVTFLSFWLLSLNSVHFASKSPITAAKNRGDLWPWFINGMLDVIPPTAKFVDGNECAYHYEAEKGHFYRSACQQRTGALGLVAPENRQKYLAQLRAGFGLYLDSYINPTNSPWYFGPVDGSRVKHFVRNLAQATDACDEYLWVYGEKKAWIPWKGVKLKHYETCGTWNQALPGLDDEMALMKAAVSVDVLHRRTAQLRRDGKYTNLVAGVKRPWPAWQDEHKRQGRTGREGEAEFLQGVESGCILVGVPAKAGSCYGVRLRMKGKGGSAPIYWQLDHKWQWQLPGATVLFAEGDENVWREGEALVRVPEGADRLVLQLGAHQLNPDDKVWFDRVEIWPLN